MSWYQFYLHMEQTRPAKSSISFSCLSFFWKVPLVICTRNKQYIEKRQKENSIGLIVRLLIGDC